MDRLLDEYLRDLESRGMTKKTVENYKSCLKALVSYLDGKSPIVVGNDELSGFLEHLRKNQAGGLTPKSISKYFSALASFYSYLEFFGKVKRNPLPAFRRRYLRTIEREAKKNIVALRQLLDVDDLRRLAVSIADVRDRAILVLAAKTGVRRQELINMDVEDIDWKEQAIQLKEAAKRTNRTALFDDETARLLRSWLEVRAWRLSDAASPTSGPLFTNRKGNRADRNDIYEAVTEHATKLGYHNPKGTIKQKFTPHCLRHWFTTHLLRAGMPREYIRELRGDAPAATMDLYTHIDRKALREAYLAKIPQLGL